MNYMIKRDGQESGPYSLDQMREIWSAGQIQENAMFRRCGTDHWLASVDLEEELAAPAKIETQATRTANFPEAVEASRGTDLQPVVVKMIDMPFGDILTIVFKFGLACAIVAPLVLLAVAISTAVAWISFIMLFK